MPRTSGHRDNLGIHWEGRVTTGEQSVELVLKTAEAQARLTPQHLDHARRSGQRMELDPVLQSHMDTK